MPEKKTRQVYMKDRLQCQLPLAVGDSYTKRFSKDSVPKNDWDRLVPKCPAIKVSVVKKIFLNFGKRFAWWDVACIPQQDCTKGYGPAAAPYPGDQYSIASAEVDKQSFVYEYASIGASWVHTQCFHVAFSRLKEVLSKTSYYFDPLNIVDYYRTGQESQPANDRKLKIIQTALSLPLFGYQANKTETEDQRKERLENTKKQVNILKDLLLEVREGDGYFRSLWSSQEVRLLKNQSFVDIHGESYDLGVEPNKKTYANFLHLAVIAAFLISQLSLAFAAAINSPAITQRSHAEINPKLLELCKRSASDKDEIEEALRKMKGSGIGFAPQETPLTVLAAARRSRFLNLNRQDNYQAMRGILALNGDFVMTYAYSDGLAIQQKKFFRVLIKKHQCKILQLAKCTKDVILGWSAVSLGHFEPVTAYFEGFLSTYSPQRDLPLICVHP